eukprot:11186420-Lingulodinium_polyedra.AAC.1
MVSALLLPGQCCAPVAEPCNRCHLALYCETARSLRGAQSSWSFYSLCRARLKTAASAARSSHL